MTNHELIKTDCGVIGGGMAGCTAALELAEAGLKVELFIKGKLMEDCNSYLTAGGLASVPLVDGIPYDGDSFQKHVEETLQAGKGLNLRKTVEFCAEHFFPDVIQWLVSRGVDFDKADTGYEFDLHKEGGHSKNRIFHVQDTTGKTIMHTLGQQAMEHPNITIHENHMAIDLITRNKIKKTGEERDICLGFYVYDIDNERVKTVSSNGVFIATGGLGKGFLYTTNMDISSGDGFAMCYRAGLPLANMEFIQFHPTVYYDPAAMYESERRFLFTEALRGEGAILKTHKDSVEDFVLKYDKLGSKSTRDVVTRAEDMEMRLNGLDHLWLDCTSIGEKKLKEVFTNSYQFALSKGINLAKEPIPVIYAVHYSNGGVMVGAHGQTRIRNCYVIGEASHTGLHGATRLASNSAPECILFGRLAAKHFVSKVGTDKPHNDVPLWDVGSATEIKDKATLIYDWETIRRTMTYLCGISRNKERLTAALRVLTALQDGINKYYWNFYVSKNFLEIRNIAEVANIILKSALVRQESRACHFREDFPNQDDEHYLGLTIIQKHIEPYIYKDLH